MLYKVLLYFIISLSLTFSASDSLFDDNTRLALTKTLNELPREVTLTLTLPEKKSQADQFSEKLLQQLTGLSHKLSFAVTRSNNTLTPQISFAAQNNANKVLLQGSNNGHLFGVLIESISLSVATTNMLAPEISQRVRALKGPIDIKVLGTASCPYCPGMAILAVKFALLNPQIKTTVININEFPQLAEKYQVRGVPLTIINEKYRLPGSSTPENLIAYLENYVK